MRPMYADCRKSASPSQFRSNSAADYARWRTLQFALDHGVTRVVLGTVAVTDPDLVAEAIHRFGAESIVVGLDARDGLVTTHGWQADSGESTLAAAQRLGDIGVRRVVVTDIARDGMLTGVNLTATADLARQSGLKVIASGGVRDLDDIRQLKAVESQGIEGVIVGQAIYTGALDLRQAIEVAT